MNKRINDLDKRAKTIKLSECWGALYRIAEAKLRYQKEYRVIIGGDPYIIVK